MSVEVSSPLTLPNGVVVPNRLAKAAMSEYLADPASNRFSSLHVRLYERWAAETHAGLLLTGNVIVTRRHLEAPRNVAVELADLGDDMLRRVALSAGNSLLVAQVSHPGRQTPISISFAPVAPSAVALNVFPSAFVTPRALRQDEIADIVTRFADTAYVLHDAGFAGIQLHAAHGYLLSTFLSPLYNRRTDKYGGSLTNRMRILMEIIQAVRNRVKDPRFIVACKLNSSDFQKGGFSEDDAINVCLALEEANLDFVELSGGNYENAVFVRHEPVNAREGFFIEFSAQLKRALKRMPVMLSGGFRSLDGMNRALQEGATDLIGIARPFAFDDFEQLRRMADGEHTAHRLQSPDTKIVSNTGPLKALNSGVEAIWYARQIELISRDKPTDPNLSKPYCLLLSVPKYFFNPTKSRIPFRKILIVAALLLAWLQLFWLRG